MENILIALPHDYKMQVSKATDTAILFGGELGGYGVKTCEDHDRIRLPAKSPQRVTLRIFKKCVNQTGHSITVFTSNRGPIVRRV